MLWALINLCLLEKSFTRHISLKKFSFASKFLQHFTLISSPSPTMYIKIWGRSKNLLGKSLNSNGHTYWTHPNWLVGVEKGQKCITIKCGEPCQLFIVREEGLGSWEVFYFFLFTHFAPVFRDGNGQATSCFI